MFYILQILAQMDFNPITPEGGISAAYIFALLVIGIGWMINRKLNQIETTLIEHAKRLNSIEVNQMNRADFEKREHDWNVEMKEMNRTINQIAIKINLLNQV
jgi:hypothetical protein